MVLVLAAAVLLAGAPALGQNARPGASSDALIAELESIEARLRDPSTSVADRADSAAKADALRARLIELLPSDDRTPTWLIDRAVLTLARLGESDTDLAVLVGLPTPEQRLRASQAALTALTLLDRAQSLAQAAVAKLESDVLSRAGAADAAEREIARLVEVEQSQRIPLYTALAKTLLAACAGGEQERTSAAAGAIKAMEALRVRTPALEAARDTVAALAVLNASGGMTDRAAGAIRTKLLSVMSNPAAEPATKARARLGLLAVGEGRATEGAPWAQRLIEQEARVRAMAGGTGASAPRRVSMLTGPVLDFMNLAAEPVLGADLGGLTEAQVRDARRALIYAKIAPLVDTKLPPSAIPAELLLARAVTTIRETPRSFSQVEALLRQVADRLEATADIRADALWELAAAYDAQPSPEKSTACLSRIVRELPASSRAADAARTLAQRFAPDYAHITSPEGRAAGVSGIKPEYLEAVRLLSTMPGESRFAAELVRAELFSDPGRVSPGALSSALKTYAGLPEGPGKSAAKAAIVLTLPAAAESLASLPSAERASLLASALEFVRSAAPEHLGAANLIFGESLLNAKDPGALALLQAASGSSIDIAGTPEGARIRLALARALRAAGQAQQAIAPLREVAAQYEKPPGEIGREPQYWAAWCELLELSILNDESPARLGELRSHLSRLELIDPSLGGAAFASRFSRLKEACKAPAPVPAAPASAAP